MWISLKPLCCRDTPLRGLYGSWLNVIHIPIVYVEYTYTEGLHFSAFHFYQRYFSKPRSVRGNEGTDFCLVILHLYLYITELWLSA